MPNRVIVKGNVGNALHSVAPDHILGTADEIFDESSQEYQSEINAGAVRADKDQSLTEEQKAKALKNQGVVMAQGSDFTNPDATKRAKVPTVGAILDGLNDGVYDVSKRNPTGGENSDGKFTLEYILSNADTLIPASWRHGGMIISFVDSSDNKYVQYRLMAQSFTTDTTQWAICDDGIYAENAKFIKVVCDKEGRILYGVTNDGDFYFGAGVPQQVQDYVLAHKEEILSALATKVDKVDGKGLSTNDFTNEEKSVVNTMELVESPKFIDVETDANSRILGGRKVDGTKFENMPVENPAAVFSSEDNPVWLSALMDNKMMLLEGIKKNGTKVIYTDVLFPNGIPSDIKKYVDNKEPEKVIPEIILPSSIYVFGSTDSNIVENQIYHDCYIKNKQNYLIDKSGGKWLYRERAFRLYLSENQTSSNLTIGVFDAIKGSQVATKTVSVVVGNKQTDNGNKVVNVIGDSFTYNGTWYNYIYQNCPNLTFTGMRHSYNADNGVYGEGRGGWRLAQYFSPHEDITPTHMQPFSPFMQVDGYTYYGVVEFWKAIVNENSQYTYGTDGFDKYKTWFDADGHKVSPSVNDLMYDGTNDIYVKWNGSAWVDSGLTDEDFEFDYSKYISTWNIDSPDFVMILLGTNDFYGVSPVSDENWNTWKSRMDIVINSINTYATSVSKTIKIGLCTPTSKAGAPNSSDGVNTTRLSIGVFSGRERMISVFDNATYKNLNVYIVDTGTACDPIYGFGETSDSNANAKPFEFYQGSFREVFGSNGVHPGTGGYKQIGVVGAAFIQAER